MSDLVHPLITPFAVPMTVYQGATFRFAHVWQLKDSSGALSPVDLTAATARARFWADEQTTQPLFANLTTANGGITLGGLSGAITINISDEQTAVLPEVKKGAWVLEILWADGDITRLMEGRFSVRPRKAYD